MTSTQYYTATSIDGFIADGDNSLGWLFEADQDGEGGSGFSEFFGGVGAFCMGSTTYEWVLAHESLLTEPAKWAQWYHDVPCWVFTRRDLPPVPGADIRFVAGDVRPVHAAMAETAAERNIWIVGGGALVGEFHDAGCLDEVILNVAPAFLGNGAQLLPRRITATRLRLANVTRRGQFVELAYDLRR